MKIILSTAAIILSASSVLAAIDVFEGTITKRIPSKREIDVSAYGKMHAYTLSDATPITIGDETKKFADLREGTKVKVTAETSSEGNRLTPVKVEIIE